MIGAGQLARMTQQAAVDLDVELTVLAASADDPAVLAGARHRIGTHTDVADLLAAAGEGDVVTFDHELVPPAHLARLERAGTLLRPGPAALRMAQDKLAARTELAAAGFPVPAFAPVATPADVTAFAADHGWPVVVKARSGGYDGRGVVVVADPAGIPDLGASPADDPAWLVEEHVALDAEVAVLVARRPGGERVGYPPVRTTQVDGICTHLVSPTGLGDGVDTDAAALADAVADSIGAVGVCAVELFVSGGRLLVNEVALRPHNSGHATIEGNATSQFHQHLRAVLDWPLGATDPVAPARAMVNLLGVEGVDPSERLPSALEIAGASVHLYGKQSRPGRKIGHVTALATSTGEALAVAAAAVERLSGVPSKGVRR